MKPIPFHTVISLYREELDLTQDFSICFYFFPGYPGRYSGPPENWAEPEPDDYEISELVHLNTKNPPSPPLTETELEELDSAIWDYLKSQSLSYFPPL
jgi:hypothetical protein